MPAQTKPKNDALVQELREAWPALIKTFGRENVLIVSNSAGTRDDAGFLQVSSHTAIRAWNSRASVDLQILSRRQNPSHDI